jgi:hypothetical protein
MELPTPFFFGKFFHDNERAQFAEPENHAAK